MTDDDYDAIEAAVTETVRGRWFLQEFARRNRAGEMREILAAVSRIEDAVGGSQTVLPADPSVRLLMQRVKEISGRLDRLAGEMRLADSDERFIRTVEEQGRAVAGMMRGPTLPTKPVAPLPSVPAAPEPMRPAPAAPLKTLVDPAQSHADPAQSLADPAASLAHPSKPLANPARPLANAARAGVDPRLRHLEAIDRLPMAEKLALFA